jgi:hypothetical protein
MEQELAEFGYKRAVEILEARGEVPIQDEELTKLRAEIADLRSKGKDEVDAAVEAERKKHKQSAIFEKRTLVLEHEKAVAELTANARSLESQNETLTAELAKAEQRLDAARELTKQVAESASRPAINQTYGGK